METVNESMNTWVPNLLTGTVIISVLAYLFKKWINSFETRLTQAEEEAEEIKKNYNRKFDEVHVKIDETKTEIIERIDKVIEDKNSFRFQQIKDMAELQSNVRHLTETIKQNGRDTRG